MRKKPRERDFQYRLRILLEMLRMGPWNKLPLTVRWLVEEYQQDFQADSCPPMHMPVTIGPVCTRKVPVDTAEEPVIQGLVKCHICCRTVTNEDSLYCVIPKCPCVSHIMCLARHFLGNNSEEILPVEGTCPVCNSSLLWGDVIRKKKGCFKHIQSSPS
uniref:Structure-specific endonuclease subunit SLX1 C-terminal domain-containing protein n=1 Tax=Cuerna arida TaxID=1464854 RepID=A0A1B6FGG6_9HEMI